MNCISAVMKRRIFFNHGEHDYSLRKIGESVPSLPLECTCFPDCNSGDIPVGRIMFVCLFFGFVCF